MREKCGDNAVNTRIFLIILMLLEKNVNIVRMYKMKNTA